MRTSKKPEEIRRQRKKIRQYSERKKRAGLYYPDFRIPLYSCNHGGSKKYDLFTKLRKTEIGFLYRFPSSPRIIYSPFRSAFLNANFSLDKTDGTKNLYTIIIHLI